MAVGLIALLDDIAALAKTAAASLDDIAAQATKAGLKAAGAVIDDAAVTPKYVQGFSAERELPIVRQIAYGSIKNKIFILLPAALLLSVFLPQLINPLLMIGGAYLCYEGAEKVFHALMPQQAENHEQALETIALDPASVEQTRIASAIKTDFILSAEIMAIALGSIEEPDLMTRAAILLLVAFGITGIVYGSVAIIVKADDFGLWWAKNGKTSAGRALGRGIVRTMPHFMTVLGIVGTAAMIWVGGGIIAHGLVGFGITAPEHIVDVATAWVTNALPAISGLASFMTKAFIDGIGGLIIGALMIPIAGYIISPIWRQVKRLLPRSKTQPSS